MAEKQKSWLLRTSTRWTHFRQVPFKRLWVLMTAVFLLFSVIGFYVDLVQVNGQMPYVVAVVMAALSEVSAVCASPWVDRSVFARFTACPPVPLVIAAVDKPPMVTAIWLDPMAVESLRKMLVVVTPVVAGLV